MPDILPGTEKTTMNKLNKIPALKVPIPDVEGRDSQYTQETNKIILESDKCSKEILKINELECGGGMGEGPLGR